MKQANLQDGDNFLEHVHKDENMTMLIYTMAIRNVYEYRTQTVFNMSNCM